MKKVLKMIMMIIIVAMGIWGITGKIQATGIEPRTTTNEQSQGAPTMPISQGQEPMDKSSEGVQTTNEASQKEEKKGNTGLAVGIGIGTVAIIGILIFWFIKTN